jgi:hypothetical protein
MISSSAQRRKAEREREPYKTPEAITDLVSMAENVAGQRRLPGQDIMEQRIASTAAQRAGDVMEGTAGTGAGIGALAMLNRGTAEAQQNLAVDAANYYAQNQRFLANALNTQAQYQDKEYMINQQMPYEAGMRASAMLKEGGMQNLWGAVSSGFGYLAQKDLMDQYVQGRFGGNTGAVNLLTQQGGGQQFANVAGSSVNPNVPATPIPVGGMFGSPASLIPDGVGGWQGSTTNPNVPATQITTGGMTGNPASLAQSQPGTYQRRSKWFDKVFGGNFKINFSNNQ